MNPGHRIKMRHLRALIKEADDYGVPDDATVSLSLLADRGIFRPEWNPDRPGEVAGIEIRTLQDILLAITEESENTR